MLALTTNLAQYSFAKCASRRADSHLGRYWPGYLVALSAPLICADLLRRKQLQYAPDQIICSSGAKQSIVQVS